MVAKTKMEYPPVQVGKASLLTIGPEDTPAVPCPLPQPPPPQATIRSSRWRADAGVPSFCELYAVVMGKEPMLWNCPKSSCHGTFPDTRNPLEPSLSITAPTWSTRGVVLLSSWVWKDVNGWALEIGISCTYSNPVVTGGQKHTHTHTPQATWMTHPQVEWAPSPHVWTTQKVE
jgi:hypothetical protein